MEGFYILLRQQAFPLKEEKGPRKEIKGRTISFTVTEASIITLQGMMAERLRTARPKRWKDCSVFPPAKDIALNFNANFFLTEQGLLYGCGKNHCAELGLGDYNERVRWYRLLLLPLKRIVNARCGTTVVQTTSGAFYQTGLYQGLEYWEEVDDPLEEKIYRMI